MGRKPTIINVASQAHVSKSTVSLVLQESPLVRDATRNHVKKVMADMGYVYNRSAAKLRSSNNDLIGLVIHDLRNPFFAEFVTSAQMAFYERGYSTVVANTDENPEIQAQVVNAMIEHGVSAIVISPANDQDSTTFAMLKKAKIPAMQVLRHADLGVGSLPFASFEYLEGGQIATKHLLAQGCKHIAFIGGVEGKPITKERMSGYVEVIQKHHLEPKLFCGASTRAFGREKAKLLSINHPEIDGAICFNDLVALGMLSGFAEMGRKVGTDFKLVGFDDIEECAEAFPQLSSINCEIGNFAKKIAGEIMIWIEEGQIPPQENRVKIEFIARKSSLG